jgi:hypothetical protein
MAVSVSAQFSMSPLSTFGNNGWLAPNGYNGSTCTYLTDGLTERGLAYGNGHLYLVSRNGGDFIRILDSVTGADLGQLNTAGVSGGYFNVNMVATGGDGAIYVGNLATTASTTTPFKVYRWTSESATPTVAYSGPTSAGARVGDSFAATGSGASTRIAVGLGPWDTGPNGYDIINPTTGTDTLVNFGLSQTSPGSFYRSIAFADSSHVVGTDMWVVNYTKFSGSAGTCISHPLITLGPVGCATVGGIPLLATIDVKGDKHVDVFDMTDPTKPKLLGHAKETVGTVPPNAYWTGEIAWGDVNGDSATLFALSTGGGIQAFTVAVPEPGPIALFGLAAVVGIFRKYAQAR